MSKLYNFFTVVVIVISILSCADSRNEIDTIERNHEAVSSPIVFAPGMVKIIEDSIKKIPAKGIILNPDTLDLPETRNFTFPFLSNSTEKRTKSTIISQKNSIKLSVLEKHFPGKNGNALPIEVLVPDQEVYEQKNGTMLYPPIVISKKEVKPTIAVPGGYKENVTQDIQYFDEFKGMHSSSVLTMLEDSRGLLWIGTLEGILRYDGITFTQYGTGNGLINDVVNSLFEDSKGNIWLGTSVGVACYNGSLFVHYTVAQGLINNEITAIAEDNEGNIWIGTRKGVCRFNGNSFVHYTHEQGLIGDEISGILVDKSGTIWFGTSEGICSFNGVGFINYPTAKNGRLSSISSMAMDKKGRIWFGSWDGGINCIDSNESDLCAGNPNLNSLIVLSIREDESGNLWLGTFGQGVICFDGNKFIQYSTKEGLVNNSVNSIIEDSSGNMWFGTIAGLNRFNKGSFINFKNMGGVSNVPILSIAEGKNNELLLGTSRGPSLYSKDSVVYLPFGSEVGDISSILRDSKGRIWFGTESGVFCYKNGILSNYKESQGLANNWVSDIKEDEHGNIWIATWGGVSFFNDSLIVNYTKRSGLGNRAVSSIFIDNQGDVWFGTMGGGISNYNGRFFTTYNSSNGLGSDKITSIKQDKSGNIWFGSYGNGLYCYNGTSFFNFTTQQGICNNYIESLVFDKDERLWIASQNGISLLTYKINSKPFQKEDEFHFYNFGLKDGLKSKKFNLNSVFIDSTNYLWWGGEKGLIAIDLERFKIQKVKPKLHLNTLEIRQQYIDYRQLLNTKPTEEITIGSMVSKKRRQIDFSSVSEFNNYPIDLELNYKLNELGFYFSAIDWQAPHKIQYQFFLDGFDNSWSFLSSENKAVYKNLPPGDYSFKVRAIGVANIWSDLIEYNFVIHPPWWSSWWARTLYIILFFSLIGAYMRFRIASLKKSKKILETKVKERTEEVELQKEELQKQNEEIKAINATLNEQKLIIEIRNESLSLQNEKILAQRDLLSKQNNAINESILYAQQIQKAVMPKRDVLNEILPENFIFFRPRDVVSGDFYWIRKIREYLIIVVADCTGHGVPGAFMSMLGISILNELVQNREITKANQALNEMRKHVKQALEQKGERGEVDDGMDLALCALNTKTNELQYSGANNSLYLIENGNFKEVKADKMPIGYYPNERPSFTNHEFKLQKGDTFYLFSDGYMDQFGGKKGFKYKAANFQQFILEISIRSLDVQKILLEQELNKWMEGFEQTDDILVMGVRV